MGFGCRALNTLSVPRQWWRAARVGRPRASGQTPAGGAPAYRHFVSFRSRFHHPASLLLPSHLPTPPLRLPFYIPVGRLHYVYAHLRCKPPLPHIHAGAHSLRWRRAGAGGRAGPGARGCCALPTLLPPPRARAGVDKGSLFFTAISLRTAGSLAPLIPRFVRVSAAASRLFYSTTRTSHFPLQAACSPPSLPYLKLRRYRRTLATPTHPPYLAPLARTWQAGDGLEGAARRAPLTPAITELLWHHFVHYLPAPPRLRLWRLTHYHRGENDATSLLRTATTPLLRRAHCAETWLATRAGRTFPAPAASGASRTYSAYFPAHLTRTLAHTILPACCDDIAAHVTWFCSLLPPSSAAHTWHLVGSVEDGAPFHLTPPLQHATYFMIGTAHRAPRRCAYRRLYLHRPPLRQGGSSSSATAIASSWASWAPLPCRLLPTTAPSCYPIPRLALTPHTLPTSFLRC